MLGTGIFDSPLNFRIDLRIGAGAFVCGEETALIESIEGKRGMPQVRPPYPAEKGLWDCPTLINNVETFANIPPIISKGAEWFAGIGTAKSKGTKVFALAGKIRYTGLVEVPMGMPLRTIVEDLGGGAARRRHDQGRADRRPLRRLHSRRTCSIRPSITNRCRQLGSIMGSGGMIVMDQTTNMVEVAKFFMEFCMDESCGKCVPCRAGTVQMHRLLSRIAAGEAYASRGEAARNAVRHGQAHQPVRPGAIGPEPGAEHAALFSAGIRSVAEKGARGAAVDMTLSLDVFSVSLCLCGSNFSPQRHRDAEE